MMSFFGGIILMSIGAMLGVGFMCCLTAGAYDDIVNGRK